MYVPSIYELPSWATRWLGLLVGQTVGNILVALIYICMIYLFIIMTERNMQNYYGKTDCVVPSSII